MNVAFSYGAGPKHYSQWHLWADGFFVWDAPGELIIPEAAEVIALADDLVLVRETVEDAVVYLAAKSTGYAVKRSAADEVVNTAQSTNGVVTS